MKYISFKLFIFVLFNDISFSISSNCKWIYCSFSIYIWIILFLFRTIFLYLFISLFNELISFLYLSSILFLSSRRTLFDLWRLFIIFCLIVNLSCKLVIFSFIISYKEEKLFSLVLISEIISLISLLFISIKFFFSSFLIIKSLFLLNNSSHFFL